MPPSRPQLLTTKLRAAVFRPQSRLIITFAAPYSAAAAATTTTTHLCRRRRLPSPFKCVAAKAPLSTKSTTIPADPQTSEQQPPSPRWVSDVRTRVGKCLGFGCDAAQTQRASEILAVLARDWRELLANSHGFLTDGRGGLVGQQVVWGEMDSFGHVNNANYIKYAESARVNWILQFALQDPQHQNAWRSLMKPESIGLIMQSIKADFKFPMTAPDTVSAYTRLRVRPEASHTSLPLDCIILSHSHRRAAARTTEEVAIYDYRKARKTQLPDFMLSLLQHTWKRQEEAMAQATEKIRELLGRVERLEKETWDRPDAVEDMGSSSTGGQ